MWQDTISTGRLRRLSTPETVPNPEKTALTMLPKCTPKEQATALFEELKMNLLTRVADRSIKSILFTGATPGAGASTSAVNVATLLTRDNQLSVLLVDANLRRPCLHHLFKTDHRRGLIGLLTEKGEATADMMRIGPEQLYLLPCGGNHSSPLSLFESSRFSEVVNAMCEQFDYVILDGPPVRSFSESRILGAKVDGVVLVVGAGKTRRQVAQRAKRDLEEAGGKILGVVVNGRKYHIPELIYSRL